MAPIRRALEGSTRLDVGVLLRAKEATDRKLLGWARELRVLTADAGCALYVHGRPDIATLVGAEGTHVGERGLPIAEVRAQWPDLGVGASRHDRLGLEQAQRDGARYAFLGPLFEVPGKNPPLGVDRFRAAIEGLTLPVYALGGISDPEGARLARRAGAHGIAVQRAMGGTPAPDRMLDALCAALDNPAPKR